MIDNRKDMSCEGFSACMAELIASGIDIAAHPHVRRCELHRALLDDLAAIASAAKQLLPDVDPPDTLWNGIQARLDLDGPVPLVSDPRPGFRVISAIRIIEHYDPQASPPSPRHPNPAAAISLKTCGGHRTPARREGRR